MKDILDLLTPLQRRILLLKLKGWTDSQIVRYAKMLGVAVSRIEEVREEIDRLLIQLLKELSEAKEVVDLLSPAVPSIPHIDIGTYSEPASLISGDFYQFIRLGNDQIGIAVGDGKGHGLRATLLSTSVHAHLHDYAASGTPPSTTLEKINDTMRQYGTPSEFVTVLYGILDIQSQNFDFSHAAHPYLFHYRHSTTNIFGPTNVESSWIPWLTSVKYSDERVQLDPGDVVVACTDGIIESSDSNDKLFGEEKLKPVIVRYAGLPADDMAKKIYQEAVAFSSDPSLPDDATVIVLKRRTKS